MARGVDRPHPLDLEVPDDVALDEGRDEAAGGGIDVDRDIEAEVALHGVEFACQRLDRLVDTGEGNAQRRHDADRVLVAVFPQVFGLQPERIAFERHLADLDVEVARELLPADLDRTGHDVRLARVLALGFAALAPLPFEGQPAEHRRLARPGRRTADRLPGFLGVPQVGEDVDAAVFDFGRLRVFVLVDHVLVDGIGHQLLDLVLYPGRAEGREVLPRIAVQQQLVAYQRIGGTRFGATVRQPVLRKAVLRGLGCIDVQQAGLVTKVDVMDGHGHAPLKGQLLSAEKAPLRSWSQGLPFKELPGLSAVRVRPRTVGGLPLGAQVRPNIACCNAHELPYSDHPYTAFCDRALIGVSPCTAFIEPGTTTAETAEPLRPAAAQSGPDRPNRTPRVPSDDHGRRSSRGRDGRWPSRPRAGVAGRG